MEIEGRRTGQIQAVGAGLCAACASLFAKLAVVSQKVPDICCGALEFVASFSGNKSESIDILKTALPQLTVAEVCSSAAICLRVLCFGLVFAFNAVMWTLFVKSLQRTSSVVATITNTASNFFFTAVSGWLLFGENLPASWWCGASLVVAGLLLINWDHSAAAADAGDKDAQLSPDSSCKKDKLT